MIRKLLIANRGEIAVRIGRTAHAMGIRTVGVFAETDRGAPHVTDLDESWLLRGATAATTYLDIAALIDIARRSGADAVHPGYGFLSERADAAEAFAAVGLKWVGPRPESIAAMGNKVEAKQLMAEAGVPMLPSTRIDLDAPGEVDRVTGEVGCPLLIKAEAGGGGRGMRIVERPDDLLAEAQAAAREAQSSFGDPRVFAERYLPAPRHVEVQVFGDDHGHVVHLGARDCSIQRRHQKLIEESPPSLLGSGTLNALTTAAVRGALSIGYVGAGTFEFLVDDDAFFFLEMNTRLQVEHPVTELVTGIDLVRWQLLVAQGAPLPLDQTSITTDGHAIEARVCAESPSDGWLPSSGPVRLWDVGPTPARWDTGVRTGSVVSPSYDSMLAKAVAFGPTRSEAVAVLARVLDELVVHGPTVNAKYLARLLRSDHFVAGDVSVEFIERHPELFECPSDTVPAIIASLALASSRRSDARTLAFAPAGWRNVAGPAGEQMLARPNGPTISVAYRCDGARFEALVEDHELAGLFELAGDRATIEIDDGPAVRSRVTIADDAVWVSTLESSVRFGVPPRHPAHRSVSAAGGHTAPVPGTVVAVHVASSDTVQAGDPLVVIEAMKIEHVVRAGYDGVVEAVLVSAGTSVDAHALLVRIEKA